MIHHRETFTPKHLLVDKLETVSRLLAQCRFIWLSNPETAELAALKNDIDAQLGPMNESGLPPG